MVMESLNREQKKVYEVVMEDLINLHQHRKKLTS